MKRSITRQERRLSLSAIAICLVLAALSPRAIAMGAGGSETVRSLYDTLLATMRNGPALGPGGRYAQIAPVVRRVFDIPFMTRLAVGPEWAGLSEPQRQQVSQAFERYIAAIYAERFDSYSGERQTPRLSCDRAFHADYPLNWHGCQTGMGLMNQS